MWKDRICEHLYIYTVKKVQWCTSAAQEAQHIPVICVRSHVGPSCQGSELPVAANVGVVIGAKKMSLQEWPPKLTVWVGRAVRCADLIEVSYQLTSNRSAANDLPIL